MAEEPLHLFPFTKWSLVLNATLNTVHKYNRVGDEDSLSDTSQNASNHVPTSTLTKDSQTGTCHDWQDAHHMLFQSRLNPGLNELFTKRLKPLKVCRQDFAEFCNLGNVVLLRKGSHYSMENHTPCGEKVSILLRGRLKVTHEGVYLHSVEPNEFVDSPEFDSLSLHSADTLEKFQVTITASEDSVIISWLYPTLRAYFATNSFLWAVFTNIIGKDISDKLYRIQEMLLKNSADTHTILMSRNSSMVNVRRCLQPADGQSYDFTTGVPIRIYHETNQLPYSALSSRNQVVNGTTATSSFDGGMVRQSTCAMLHPCSECFVHYHNFHHNESKSSVSSF